jgi:type I restriction enzyme M protein
MMNWTEIVEQKLQNQKNSIAKINLEKVTVSYSEKVKLNRVLKALTGDEEIVRAFLIDRLVSSLKSKYDFTR